MEVHHHPHVEKKNFKEYFLEFLMIFLAVTLGFFAESYREHIVDKDRIHDYMKEMVENLKYDSARCLHNYQANLALEKGMDSLRTEIKNSINGNINSNALYYYSFQYFGNFSEATFNNSAITELKSSGSFRLIGNKDLTGEIYDYYQRKINAADACMPSKEEIDETTKIGNEFFGLVAIDNFVESFDSMTSKTYTGNYNYQIILHHDPSLQLLKKYPADLSRLYTAVAEFEIKLKAYNFWLLYCKDSSKKLINDIRQEYHL